MSEESDWDGPNYAELSGQAPFDKPTGDYSPTERRAEIYGMIEDAGHPRNLERNQAELGKRYDVSQQQISKDMAKIREFEASHNGQRAKAVVSWLAEKAVQQAVENEDFEKAFELQQEYVEYLFETGDIEVAADELRIEGDAGAAYMEMLRQAHDENAEE